MADNAHLGRLSLQFPDRPDLSCNSSHFPRDSMPTLTTDSAPGAIYQNVASITHVLEASVIKTLTVTFTKTLPKGILWKEGVQSNVSVGDCHYTGITGYTEIIRNCVVVKLPDNDESGSNLGWQFSLQGYVLTNTEAL